MQRRFWYCFSTFCRQIKTLVPVFLFNIWGCYVTFKNDLFYNAFCFSTWFCYILVVCNNIYLQFLMKICRDKMFAFVLLSIIKYYLSIIKYYLTIQLVSGDIFKIITLIMFCIFLEEHAWSFWNYSSQLHGYIFF